jgi:transcriptional regulator with XRE-family HTH domain
MKKTITGVNEVLANMALRWYRELRFLLVTEVAEKAGISEAYLSFLESGRRPLSRKMEKRIIEAINSMSEETRTRTIKFAIRRINEGVFRDPIYGKYRWTGSLVNKNAFQFVTEGIKVEISTSPSEPEELFVLETKKPLFSGRILVNTPEEGKVRYFLLHRDVEDALEELGKEVHPKAADLLQKLEPVLVFLFEVRPKTVGEQLSQILKAK